MALRIGCLLTRVYQCSKQCLVANGRYATTLQIFQRFGSNVDYPEKPKKPQTPFLRYMKDNRPRLESIHGALPRKIIIFGAEEWRSLSEAEKQPYLDEYKFEFERYREIMSDFMDSLTEDQKQAMKNDKEEKKKKVLAKKKQRAALSQGKPKLPATAFGLYVKERFSELRDTLSHEERKDIFSKLASEWKNMTEGEKQKFTDRAKEGKQEYTVAMDAWEERMIQLGQIDMIRESTKKQLRKSGKA